MFTPKYPRPDTPPTTATVVPIISDAHAPACTCGHAHTPAAPAPAPASVSSRPTVQLTPGALITLAVGGTTAILVIGTVLVSMLLAVAVTGASVAVCALVIRSLLKEHHTHR